jgi:hypothetical protein
MEDGMSFESDTVPTELAAAINAQYGPANLVESILTAFKDSGKVLANLTRSDLLIVPR